ncbi:MAG: beta-ketoacyl-[acyl-carrier-protein] synthase family protein [Acidobacteria bacterium]|nr:beta-ketoacyl-[acyl-carrier-protein] synthase family protein [Acidobacteriota bacterium]
MTDNRVVITGLGVVAANGVGKDAFWRAITNGVSAIREVTSFDTSDLHTHLAAEVLDFCPERHIHRRPAHSMGRAAQLAIAAAREALADAGIDPQRVNPERAGIVVGTTQGEAYDFEQALITRLKEGYDKLTTAEVRRANHGAIINHMAAEFQLYGPAVIVATACSAGNYAVGYAGDLIRLGRADVVVAGGVEPFFQTPFVGFNRLGAVAPEMCQPFDLNRKGAIFGEGSGFLVMESLAHARKRGAGIYAEFRGYALSCDAYHPTAPDPEGRQAALMIRQALSRSQVAPESVNYISAHGTGTKANDRVEARVIKDVFQANTGRIPVSSIKSMIGHTMGAAAAIEAVCCVLAIQHGVAPPTINHFETDPACNIDVVANVARELPIRVAINNSFAFGGNNACTVFSRFNQP